MNLSIFVLTFLLAAANVNAFRVGSDGNQDLMKKAVEDALLSTVMQPPVKTSTEDAAPPLRNQLLGTEVPCLYEYWSRPDIHTFGNMGFGGAVHAAVAPIATKVS
jgi:hypothetical protein